MRMSGSSCDGKQVMFLEAEARNEACNEALFRWSPDEIESKCARFGTTYAERGRDEDVTE